MQGTARLLAAITVLLFSPQLSGDAQTLTTQTLSTQAIVQACEKGQPQFNGKKLGNVSNDVFVESKKLLAGDRTDIDPQIDKSLCIVALWRASHDAGLDRYGIEDVRKTTPNEDTKIGSHNNASSDKATQEQILGPKKELDGKRQTQSTVYETCLVISVLAVILAGFAVLYSRSATRRALRAAGLL